MNILIVILILFFFLKYSGYTRLFENFPLVSRPIYGYDNWNRNYLRNTGNRWHTFRSPYGHWSPRSIGGYQFSYRPYGNKFGYW